MRVQVTWLLPNLGPVCVDGLSNQSSLSHPSSSAAAMSSAKLSLGLAARAGSAVVVVDTGGDARRIGAGGGFGGASVAGVGSGAAVPPTNMENMSSNVSSGAGARSRGRAASVSLVVVVDGTDAIVGVSTRDSRGTDGGSGVGDDARPRSSDSRSRLARSTSASSATRLTHAYADVVSLLASVTGAPIVDNGAEIGRAHV